MRATGASRAGSRPGATRTTAGGAAEVDPERWPGAARVPHAPVRARVAELIVRRALGRLPLRVTLPGGEQIGAGGRDSPALLLHRPERFFSRVGAFGLIGFGESYMAGEWDAGDLVGALEVLARDVGALVPRPLQRLRGLWARRQPGVQDNTPDGSRANIHRHYDLSNALFALFLDETMTYSSAVFPTDGDGRPVLDPAADPDALLAAGQHRKIDRLLDLAGVGPGTRLLEIGTGWGELALRAAARGAHVVTTTLSHEQQRLAVQRIAEAGCEDRVTVLLRDYRELNGSYDAVVSVEMIEAVGERYWPVYFSVLERVLAPGGRIALQGITMPHDRMRASRHTYTWIQKYIFPGGLLPSVTAIEQVLARDTGLGVARRDAFGDHYAQTLRLWRERFTERAAEVDGLGFDETFRRMWTFYLAYSEAGFRSRYLDVQQLLILPR